VQNSQQELESALHGAKVLAWPGAFAVTALEVEAAEAWAGRGWARDCMMR